PIWLTTGRLLQHYHTGSMTRRSKVLNKIVPYGRVEINPGDAKRLGVKNGEKVKVTSRRGTIDIEAQVTTRVQEGVVFIPFHFIESGANFLTNDALDPVAKIPEYKVCAVKVEKV
nr:molybdopterin dinucleotide binding domain-containing protein [Tenuifilaceae bacterium]